MSRKLGHVFKEYIIRNNTQTHGACHNERNQKAGGWCKTYKSLRVKKMILKR